MKQARFIHDLVWPVLRSLVKTKQWRIHETFNIGDLSVVAEPWEEADIRGIHPRVEDEVPGS